MSRIEGTLAAATAVAVVCAAVALFPFPALAGLAGSPHDFSASHDLYSLSPISKQGACSICHIPHAAQYGYLWPRSLATYDNALSMDGSGGASGKPNYKRPVTLQCYDCHDAHQTAVKVESSPVPAFSGFVTDRKPQNVAFGFNKKAPLDSGSTMKEDAPGAAEPGFYENTPPNNSPNPDSTYYGADSGAGSPFRRGSMDNATLARTGGHFFRSADPNATAGIYKGDKLPCNDCHNPHAWKSDGSWQAFIRTSWPPGSPVPGRLSASPAWLGRASEYMANDSIPSGRRSNSESRKICVMCHGESTGINDAVRFTEINARYTNTARIVRPPATVPEHAPSSSAACVSCHAHNSVFASCTQCHGNPPSYTATIAYPADFAPTTAVDNDSHPRHFGKMAAANPNDPPVAVRPYAFSCEVCHYGSIGTGGETLAQHNNRLMSVVIQGRYTKAGGSWDNTNYYNWRNGLPAPSGSNPYTGQLDNSAAAAGWGTSGQYGGNECRNVYCHSAGRDQDAMSADNNADYRRPRWNSGPMHCNDCHGQGTDNVAGGGLDWGMPNYPSGVVGSRTANSHAKHVVGSRIDCFVCHFETVTTDNAAARAIRTDLDPARHVNTLRDVVFDGTQASGTYDNAIGSKTCVVTCHGNNPVQWGGSAQTCDKCHAGVGDIADFGTGSPGSMSRNGVTARIDNTEWATSGHGRDAGQYEISLNPAANLLAGSPGRNACAFCHAAFVAHDNASNPFRLANQDWNGLDWNGVCLVCHSSIAGKTSTGYQPPADNTGSYALKTASAATQVGNNHFNPANPGSVSNARHSTEYNGGKFCFDCHDPHGDRAGGAGNIIMIARRAAMKTDNVYGIPVGGTAGPNRPDVVFTNNVNGSDFVTEAVDNVAPYDGVCEACHEAASGILHYTGAGRLDPAPHNPTRCTQCHTHDGGFKGLGGPDVGQYFDRAIQAPGSLNIWDNSSHPLRGLTTGDTTLRFASQGNTNCLGCHYQNGPARTSDECLMCHFENAGGSGTTAATLGPQHMNGVLEMAAISSNATVPASRYAIAGLVNFDAWCLQCHEGTTQGSYSLGGIFAREDRKTLFPTGLFAAGRHRIRQAGCIYCHSPHGSGNARLVRSNPANRGSADNGAVRGVPTRFKVFPNDNSGSYTGFFNAALDENVPYRARYDNVAPNVFADAADDSNFCNTACHDPYKPKEKIISRDNTTGLYALYGTSRKYYLVGPDGYTIDNLSLNPDIHVHVSNEIISTDDMVTWFAAPSRANLSGPSRYRYPGGANANPNQYRADAALPMFPDYADSVRDFTNGYLNQGLLRYRYTCSTCHNPHGTLLANGAGQDGYPDLRLGRNNNALCNECHR